MTPMAFSSNKKSAELTWAQTLDQIVVRNRKHWGFLHGSVSRVQDAETKNYYDKVDYNKIFYNVFGGLLTSKFAQSFIPLIVLASWNTIQDVIGELNAISVARTLFFVRNIVFVLSLYLINKNLTNAINRGEMNNTVQVETSEWDEASSAMKNVKITKTYGDYDKGEIGTFVMQQAFQMCVVALLHGKYEYTTPLVLASFVGMQSLWKWPIFRIWVKGETAEESIGSSSSPKKTSDDNSNSNSPSSLLTMMSPPKRSSDASDTSGPQVVYPELKRPWASQDLWAQIEESRKKYENAASRLSGNSTAASQSNNSMMNKLMGGGGGEGEEPTSASKKVSKKSLKNEMKQKKLADKKVN